MHDGVTVEGILPYNHGKGRFQWSLQAHEAPQVVKISQHPSASCKYDTIARRRCLLLAVRVGPLGSLAEGKLDWRKKLDGGRRMTRKMH